MNPFTTYHHPKPGAIDGSGIGTQRTDGRYPAHANHPSSIVNPNERLNVQYQTRDVGLNVPREPNVHWDIQSPLVRPGFTQQPRLQQAGLINQFHSLQLGELPRQSSQLPPQQPYQHGCWPTERPAVLPVRPLKLLEANDINNPCPAEAKFVPLLMACDSPPEAEAHNVPSIRSTYFLSASQPRAPIVRNHAARAAPLASHLHPIYVDQTGAPTTRILLHNVPVAAPALLNTETGQVAVMLSARALEWHSVGLWSEERSLDRIDRWRDEVFVEWTNGQLEDVEEVIEWTALGWLSSVLTAPGRCEWQNKRLRGGSNI